MTIEIADRLVKLRKKYGYSQEELADKLGLSRQAVSKWERAEASPDTDNLICLAKLYGVSLDELLATDEDLDTIVEEQVKEEKEEKQDDRVVINNKGVFLTDKKGSKVSITDEGIFKTDKDGNVTKKEIDKKMAIIGSVEATLFVLATVAYIVLGATLGLWHCAWVLFFVPEIICSILRSIRKRNMQYFNMPFAVMFAFFFVCMWIPGLEANLWHPMWAVFLGIPLYYTTGSLINKALGKEDPHDKKEDDDDEDDN